MTMHFRMGGKGIIMGTKREEPDPEQDGPPRIRYKIRMEVMIVEVEGKKGKTEAKEVWEDNKIFVADILRRTKRRKLEPDHLLEYNPEEIKGLKHFYLIIFYHFD